METKLEGEKIIVPELELPPEPPLRSAKKGKFGSISMGGGLGQMVAVAIVVSLLVVVGVGMFGGGNLVSKADFTRNMSGVGAVLEQMKADFDSATQSIPTQVGQANTQMNSVISSLKERVSVLESQIADQGKRIKMLEDMLRISPMR